MRTALLGYVVAPLVASLALVGAITLRGLEDLTERRMQEDVELVARAIRRPLSRAVEQERHGNVRRTLKSLYSIGRVYDAYVYDTDGMVIASAGEVEPEPQLRRVTRIAAKGDQTGEYGELSGRRIYSYFVPLTDSGGRINALLRVTRRRSDFEQYLGDLRRHGWILLLASSAGMVGVVLLGHHGALGKHVQRLASDMSEVERGRRDHRAVHQGPAEIKALGRSLNTMLDSMARSESELEERRTAQSDLEERLRQAEKLAAIGQLAAGVAHELGTPLSVIDGKAQRFLRRPESEAPDESMREIRNEVRRMEHVVRQLLDFGKVRSTRRELFPADRLVQRAAAMVREECEQDQITLQISGPEPVPELYVDDGRLEQALVNLLRNAMQATPGGRIALAWFERNGETGISIEDDGPGIPPEIQARIFEPFFTTKGVGRGTGLGLAVVHGVVEELEGRIDVDRSPAGGARFRLVLPGREALDGRWES